MVMVCFLLMKLSQYVLLNVQTQCWAWIKLATDNFSTVLTRNLRNPRDYAPLNKSKTRLDRIASTAIEPASKTAPIIRRKKHSLTLYFANLTK